MPGRRQAITWTNDGILLIGPLGTNFREILSKIHTFSFKKMHLKTSSAKWRPFCLGLNVLTHVRILYLESQPHPPGTNELKFQIRLCYTRTHQYIRWCKCQWHYINSPDTECRKQRKLVQDAYMGPYHGWISHHNSISMEILFSSHQNFNKVRITEFCTWYANHAVQNL